ncbi:phosphohistidine phosphatase SixA [Volucribacter amazonae]|uniref:Phosphohistidine phosphatase SixA n=1 Tax=Volucribacter amazonae TaxID=256731 RepID=A0A9X4P828_9PAST|nr:phosphohistidine phosphatase SixA [Volucribacter amazonae]MDG6894243.1 hypothetical protein [Volucribacter amazonae]
MKILVMRHGEAEVMAKSDQLRPLTLFGQQQSGEQGEKLFKAGIYPQYVLVSPYLRAQQTFVQVNRKFVDGLKQETWQELTPYGDANLVRDYVALLNQQGVDCLLIISHLPLVGSIVNEFCANQFVSFYPATIAELDWDGQRGKLIRVYQGG